MDPLRKKRVRSYAKHWCLTWNNPDKSKSDFLTDIRQFREVTYLVIASEVGESGTPHFQGYIAFEKRVDLKILHEWNKNIHWEKSLGVPKRASDYCMKGEQSHEEWATLGVEGPNYGLNADYEVWGELPLSGPQVRSHQFEDAYTLAKENKVEEVEPEFQLKYLSSLNKIADRELKQPRELDDTCGVWVFGPPGSGKTRWANNEYGSTPGSLYNKLANKWWDHYKGEPNVLLDDIDPECCKYLAHHLKHWMDRYSFKCEYKGGARDLRPQVFIVTSNYSIEECFSERDAAAITRRCDIVEFRGNPAVGYSQYINGNLITGDGTGTDD